MAASERNPGSSIDVELQWPGSDSPSESHEDATAETPHTPVPREEPEPPREPERTREPERRTEPERVGVAERPAERRGAAANDVGGRLRLRTRSASDPAGTYGLLARLQTDVTRLQDEVEALRREVERLRRQR